MGKIIGLTFPLEKPKNDPKKEPEKGVKTPPVKEE